MSKIDQIISIFKHEVEQGNDLADLEGFMSRSFPALLLEFEQQREQLLRIEVILRLISDFSQDEYVAEIARLALKTKTP